MAAIATQEGFIPDNFLEMMLKGCTFALHPYHDHLPDLIEMILKGGIATLYPYHSHYPNLLEMTLKGGIITI